MSKTNNLTKQESSSTLKEKFLQRSKSKDKSHNSLKLSQVLNSVKKDNIEKLKYKSAKENLNLSKNKMKSQIFNNNYNNKNKSDFHKFYSFNNNFSNTNAGEKKPNSIGHDLIKSSNLVTNLDKQNNINNLKPISKANFPDKETYKEPFNKTILEPSKEKAGNIKEKEEADALQKQLDDNEILLLMHEGLDFVSIDPKESKISTKVKINEIEEGKKNIDFKTNKNKIENENKHQTQNQIDALLREKSKKKAETKANSKKQVSQNNPNEKNIGNIDKKNSKQPDPFDEIFENEEIDSILSMINNDAEFFKYSKKKKEDYKDPAALNNGFAREIQENQNECLDSTTKAVILQVIEEISERKEMESINRASEPANLNSFNDKNFENFNSNNKKSQLNINKINNGNINSDVNNNTSNKANSNKPVNNKNNTINGNLNYDANKKDISVNNNFSSNFNQNKNINKTNNNNNFDPKNNQNINNINIKKNSSNNISFNNQGNKNISGNGTLINNKSINIKNKEQINSYSNNQTNLQISKDNNTFHNFNPLNAKNNSSNDGKNLDSRAYNNQHSENNFRKNSLDKKRILEEKINNVSVNVDNNNNKNLSRFGSSYIQNQKKDQVENNQLNSNLNAEYNTDKIYENSHKMDICDKQISAQIQNNYSNPNLFAHCSNLLFDEAANNCFNKNPWLHNQANLSCFNPFYNPYPWYPPLLNPIAYPYPPCYNPYLNFQYNPYNLNPSMPVNNQISNSYQINNPNNHMNKPTINNTMNPFGNLNIENSKKEDSYSSDNWKTVQDRLLEIFKILNDIKKEKEVSENNVHSNNNSFVNLEKQNTNNNTNQEALEKFLLNSLQELKPNLTRENLLANNINKNMGNEENVLLNANRNLNKREGLDIENNDVANNNHKNNFEHADKIESNGTNNAKNISRNNKNDHNFNLDLNNFMNDKSTNQVFIPFQKADKISNENNFQNANETLNFNFQSEKNKLLFLNNENNASNVSNFEEIFDTNNPLDLKTIEDKEFDRILNRMEKKPNKQKFINNLPETTIENKNNINNPRKPFQPPKAKKSFKMEDFDEKTDKFDIEGFDDNEFDSFLKNIKNSDFKNLNTNNGNFGFKKAINCGDDETKNKNDIVKGDKVRNDKEIKVLSDFISIIGCDNIEYKVNPRLKKLQEEMEKDVYSFNLEKENDKAKNPNKVLVKANNNTNNLNPKTNKYEKGFTIVNNSFINNPVKRIHSEISNISLNNFNDSLDMKAMEQQHFDKRIQKLERGVKIIKNGLLNQTSNNTSDPELNQKNNANFKHNNKKNSLIKLAANTSNINLQKNNDSNNIFSMLEKNGNKNNNSNKEESNKNGFLQRDNKQNLSNRSIDNFNENTFNDNNNNLITQEKENDLMFSKIDEKALFEYQDFTNKNIELECISDYKIYCKKCFDEQRSFKNNNILNLNCDNCFDFKFISKENIKQIFSDYYKKVKIEEIQTKSNTLFQFKNQSNHSKINSSSLALSRNEVTTDNLISANSESQIVKQKKEFEQSELKKLSKCLEKISSWESGWFLLQFSYISYRVYILNKIFSNNPNNKINSAFKTKDINNSNFNNLSFNNSNNNMNSNNANNSYEISEHEPTNEFNFINILSKLYKNFNHVYESGLRSFLTKLYDKDYTLNQAIILLIFNSTATDKDSYLLELTDIHRIVYSRIHSSNPVFSLIKNGILKPGIKLKIATSKIESTDEAKIFISLFHNCISIAPITEKLGLAAQPQLLKNLVNIREDGGPVSKVDVILLKKFSCFVYNKTQNKRKSFNKFAKEKEAAAENAAFMAQNAADAEGLYVERDFDYIEENYHSDAMLVMKGKDKDKNGVRKETMSKAAGAVNCKNNYKEVYSEAAVAKNNGHNALQNKKAPQIKKNTINNKKNDNLNNSFGNQSLFETDEISICFKIICIDTTAYYSILNKIDPESSIKLYNLSNTPLSHQKNCNISNLESNDLTDLSYLEESLENPDDITLDEFNTTIYSAKFQNKLAKLCSIEISAKSADLFEELEEGKRYFLSNFNKSNSNSAYGARKSLLRLKAYQELIIEEASPKLNLLNPKHKETLKNLLEFLKYDKNETEISEALQKNNFVYDEFQEKEFYCVGLLQDYFIDGKDAFLVLRSANKNLVLVKIHDFDFFDLSSYSNLVNTKNKKVISVKNVLFQIIHYLENSMKVSLEGKNIFSDFFNEKIIIYVETSNYSEFKSEDTLLPKFNSLLKENQELADSDYLKELKSFVTGKKSLNDC